MAKELHPIEVYDAWPFLDQKITAPVLLLRSKGISTFASCQGGTEHCTPYPWIRFWASRYSTVRKAAELLRRRGYFGFSAHLFVNYELEFSVRRPIGEIIFYNELTNHENQMQLHLKGPLYG